MSAPTQCHLPSLLKESLVNLLLSLDEDILLKVTHECRCHKLHPFLQGSQTLQILVGTRRVPSRKV